MSALWWTEWFLLHRLFVWQAGGGEGGGLDLLVGPNTELDQLDILGTLNTLHKLDILYILGKLSPNSKLPKITNQVHITLLLRELKLPTSEF